MQSGTHVITRLMAQTSEQELAKADETWCKTHLSIILAKQSRAQPTIQEENKTIQFQSDT